MPCHVDSPPPFGSRSAGAGDLGRRPEVITGKRRCWGEAPNRSRWDTGPARHGGEILGLLRRRKTALSDAATRVPAGRRSRIYEIDPLAFNGKRRYWPALESGRQALGFSHGSVSSEKPL